MPSVNMRLLGGATADCSEFGNWTDPLTDDEQTVVPNLRELILAIYPDLQAIKILMNNLSLRSILQRRRSDLDLTPR